MKLQDNDVECVYVTPLDTALMMGHKEIARYVMERDVQAFYFYGGKMRGFKGSEGSNLMYF